MKAEFKEEGMLLVAQDAAEKAGMEKMFAQDRAAVSGPRRVVLKEFVDRFGKGSGEFYLLVKPGQIEKNQEPKGEVK